MKRLISRILPCFFIGATILPANAQQLPSLPELPWVGFFSAYEHRDFHFGIDSEGEFALYLMKNRKERAAQSKVVKVYSEVLVVLDNGKKIYKRLKDDGLETELEAGLDHKEVVFTAVTEGDAKVQITVKYAGDKVIMDGKVLDRGKLKDGKLFFSFKVLMPAFYQPQTYSKDKDKAKARMRRDKFRFIRADNGKRESIKVYKEHDLASAELGGGLVTELEVDMDAQEGRTFVFSSLDGKARLQLASRYEGKKSEPWRGYYVKWYRPMEEEKGKEVKPFVIEGK